MSNSYLSEIDSYGTLNIVVFFKYTYSKTAFSPLSWLLSSHFSIEEIKLNNTGRCMHFKELATFAAILSISKCCLWRVVDPGSAGGRGCNVRMRIDKRSTDKRSALSPV